MLCKALVLLVCFCFYSSFVLATDTTAPDNPTTTTPYTFDPDDGTMTSPTFGCPSGTSAMIHTGETGIRFGECVNTFAISYAINQALAGTGVSIDKAHYEWKYIHCFNTDDGNGTREFCSANIENRVNTNTGAITDNTSWDELVVVVEVTDSSGNVVETKTWTMDTWYEWTSSNAHSSNEVQEGSTYWQIHEDNIEIYNHTTNAGTIRTPNSVGDVRFRITGYDKGNWDGYYGPIIKDMKTWFTYRANPCNDTALYDSSCPGYADALATYEYNTACSADATYDSGCPGYATAYYNQQCSADPLYDSGCSGYATAYYNQQCSADPLYDSGCTGYAEAYYTQQCTANPLYDSGCTGYETAYYNYQCSADPLYDSGCTGYAEAYYTQQCTANPLYDSGCTGYAEAYLNQQCTADPLYDASCTGHFEAQCEVNTLYSSQCTGYSEAYFNQQCLYNPQYDSLCQGYQAPVVDVPEVGDIGIPGTGDSVVDNIISLPPARMPDVIILPQPSAPEPEPIEVVVIPTEIVVIDAPVIVAPVLETDLAPEVQQIEAEVEAQIELELSIDVEPEPEMEMPNESQEEEPSSDVEQSVDNDGPDEDSNDSESSQEDSSTEDTEGDTEETVEENTEDESTEDETTEEESTEEESTEEEATEEESSEEESTEEEAAEDETTEEKPVVKKKNIKKLTKAQKEKAKKEKMKEIIKDKLNKLAEDMGKAQTLEAQQALQQIIAALINYVPGFNAYGQVAIPGVDFYNQDEIYKDKKVPENLRGLRNGLASELLHKKMVDMQYEGMD